MAEEVTTKYNEQDYTVSFYIDNNEGSAPSKQFPINPNAVVNFTVEETLADWVTRATLSIYQTFDTIENKTEGSLDDVDFSFNNDGTDVVYVKIFPKLEDVGLEVDRVHWELVYKLAIYDVEDIDLPPGAQGAAAAFTKCKKFYLWDRWYQKMITNTMEYSTALSDEIAATPAPGQSLTDEERSLPTGVAMKEVLEKALLNEENKFNDIMPTSIDSLAGGGEGAWDDGDSKIFYTAPAFASAYDSLMYLYSRHVSSESILGQSGAAGPRGSGSSATSDFCILTKERGPEEGDEGFLSLRPMSEYFEKAGKNDPKEFQIERFLVQGSASEKVTPHVKRAPKLDEQNMQIDTKLGHYSMITSYRFVDIAPYTNSFSFTTHPVHSIDFKNRTLSIEFQNNTVDTAKNFITKKYINNVLTESPDNSFVVNIDEDKTTNRNIKPSFSLHGQDFEEMSRQADGLQKLLKTGVFQNMCVNFRTLGSTNRTTGRFVAIDIEGGIDEENIFNDKFFGQWFIINIKHVFESGMYYNDITAIKVHKFK